MQGGDCLRKKGVIICAAGVSIGIHLAGLAVLAFVSTSQSGQAGGQFKPTGRVSRSRITYLMNATGTAPKPKIKEALSRGSGQAAQRTRTISSVNGSYKSGVELRGVGGQFVANAGLGSSNDLAQLPVVQDGGGDEAGAVVPQKMTEFFGSSTDKRKICYLVDCSGSMQGMFGRVQKELYKSIGGLEQDQYFAVIFFGNGRLIEFENGRLVRASRKNKDAVCEFIGGVRPAGQGDTLAALNKALQGVGGLSPQIVYFLTDGFELAEEGSQKLEGQIEAMSAKNAGASQINPIAFWPQEQDKKMLQTLSEKSGGEFVEVVDESVPMEADKKR
jgi:hypothetical protein